MKKFFVFDLETKRLAQEVGGWNHIDRLGLSAAVLLDIKSDTYLHFTEDLSQSLIETILDADRIIGFNLIRFDYVVLIPYGLNLTSAIIDKTTDLLLDIYQSLGFRVSLDNLAATFLNGCRCVAGIDHKFRIIDNPLIIINAVVRGYKNNIISL